MKSDQEWSDLELMNCLCFCALSLEAKENRFICYKLLTPRQSDDGLKDETTSLELGVALALLQWVGTVQMACRLARGETCCNTNQKKSPCKFFFSHDELM